MGRLQVSCKPFNDEGYLNLLDILGKTYSLPPSEFRKMNWEDLIFNVHCLLARSRRFKKALQKNKTKKTMLFPNLSVSDMIDMIG